MLQLQRTAGNQAVLQMLDVGKATDARGGAEGAEEVEDRRLGPATIARVPDAGTPPTPDAGTPAARPTPVAVRNGPAHAPIDTADKAGMSIAITITSSSGTDADMAAIQDSEQVGLSINHTGSMVGMAALPSNQSGFMAGHPIPDDRHAWWKSEVIDRADNHGGDGSFEKEQLDVYKDAAGGVTAATVIPNSGYIIKREVKKTGTAITLRTEKRAAGVTVNGFTTAAGPSATQACDVVVRAATP